MDELAPYFRALARQRRVCPRCMRCELRVAPTPVPRADMALETCEACGHFRLLTAPSPGGGAGGPRPCRILAPAFGGAGGGAGRGGAE